MPPRLWQRGRRSGRSGERVFGGDEVVAQRGPLLQLVQPFFDDRRQAVARQALAQDLVQFPGQVEVKFHRIAVVEARVAAGYVQAQLGVAGQLSVQGDAQLLVVEVRQS